MIKAILYDLDGVLVDATEWHYESLNLALEQVKNFKIKRDEHIQTFNGLPTMRKLEILLEQGRVEKNDFNSIWQKKQDLTIEVIKKSAFVDSNKLRLHDATKQYKIVCVTNSIRETALLMLEKTGQLNYIDFVISNEDVSSPKPSPEGYLQAISRLKIKPEECMIVEDSPKGIEAANNSGAQLFEVSGYNEVTLENVLLKLNYFNFK
jgi:beta-phosphoglucomutase